MLALPEEHRQHAGNLGYDDDVRRVYRYDSMVPNWRQLQEGDLAVLRSDQMIGIAQIAEIVDKPGPKTLRRCPFCHTTKLKPRRTKLPVYRCHGCHAETDTPTEEIRHVTLLEARFGTSFVETLGAISVAELRAACPRYNGNLAMQEIEVGPIAERLRARFPDATQLLSVWVGRAAPEVDPSE